MTKEEQHCFEKLRQLSLRYNQNVNSSGKENAKENEGDRGNIGMKEYKQHKEPREPQKK